MDEPRRARVEAGFGDHPRSLHVGAADAAVGVALDRDARREVEHHVHPRDGRADRRRVADVARDARDREAADALVAVVHEGAHGAARVEEGAREARAEVPGRTGDERGGAAEGLHRAHGAISAATAGAAGAGASLSEGR